MNLKWQKWVLFLRVAPIARAIVFLQLSIREGMFDQGTTKDCSFLPLGKKTQNSLKGCFTVGADNNNSESEWKLRGGEMLAHLQVNTTTTTTTTTTRLSNVYCDAIV